MFGRDERAELVVEKWKTNRVRCRTLSFWLRCVFPERALGTRGKTLIAVYNFLLSGNISFYQKKKKGCPKNSQFSVVLSHEVHYTLLHVESSFRNSVFLIKTSYCCNWSLNEDSLKCQ